MTVIFDLDYTLMDTAAFKKALSEEFAACGVSGEFFPDSRAGTVGSIAPEASNGFSGIRAPEFAHRADRASGNLSRRIDGVLRRSREFVFSGVVRMLDGLRDRGVRLVLLSLGDEEWQRKKIAFAELERAFDVVRIVPSDKSSVIREFADGGAVVVVNDDGAEIDAMTDVAPEFIYVLKRGPKSLPETTEAIVCDTIPEVDAAVRRAIGLRT